MSFYSVAAKVATRGVGVTFLSAVFLLSGCGDAETSDEENMALPLLYSDINGSWNMNLTTRNPDGGGISVSVSPDLSDENINPLDQPDNQLAFYVAIEANGNALERCTIQEKNSEGTYFESKCMVEKNILKLSAIPANGSGELRFRLAKYAENTILTGNAFMAHPDLPMSVKIGTVEMQPLRETGL